MPPSRARVTQPVRPEPTELELEHAANVRRINALISRESLRLANKTELNHVDAQLLSALAQAAKALHSGGAIWGERAIMARLPKK